MRIIVFFDLPTERAVQRRAYNEFRKFLIKSGFMMMQESVYSKLVLNTVAADTVIASLREHRPKEGVVQILTITEKQFSKIEYLVGDNCSAVIDSTERVVYF